MVISYGRASVRFRVRVNGVRVRVKVKVRVRYRVTVRSGLLAQVAKSTFFSNFKSANYSPHVR